MMMTPPPFPQAFAFANGQLSPAWTLWFNTQHQLMSLQGHSFLVSALPIGTYAGQQAYASDGRKSGEGAGAGTGVPVWWNGTSWLTFYNNSVVIA